LAHIGEKSVIAKPKTEMTILTYFLFQLPMRKNCTIQDYCKSVKMEHQYLDSKTTME